MSRPGILALHGFTQGPGQWNAVLTPGTFRAPALVGHHGVTGGETFWEEVSRLAGVASELPSPRVLLGYSMGARAALALRLAYPSLFSKTILIAVNPGCESEAERLARLELEQEWKRTLTERGLEAFLSEFERLPVLGTQRRNTPEWLEQESLRRSHGAGGLCRALEVLGLGVMPNLWEAVSLGLSDCDLIVGSLDKKFLAIGQRFCQTSPGSRLFVVEDAGHNPILESPEKTRSLLQELITKAAP